MHNKYLDENVNGGPVDMLLRMDLCVFTMLIK